MSSLILGVSGAYFEYSASKNYDNYKNAKTDAVSYREKVELADDMKLKLFISSGVLMGATAYLHIKGKKVENIQHDQPVN
jgi:predicted metal-dependent RNase